MVYVKLSQVFVEVEQWKWNTWVERGLISWKDCICYAGGMYFMAKEDDYIVKHNILSAETIEFTILIKLNWTGYLPFPIYLTCKLYIGMQLW